MGNLADYYCALLKWEQVPPKQLVYPWPLRLREAVESDIRRAVLKSGIKGEHCPIRPNSTNQSIGNQVEAFVVNRLIPHGSSYCISPCPGAGYPDKMLADSTSTLTMSLELKATSDWNPSDTNRRVLTSSSRKLRQRFRTPIYHLLMTVLYTNTRDCARIDAIRLDFLEPTTSVNVRLEASVNHKILATGPHHSVII